MKKIITLFSVLLLVFALSACSRQEKEPEPEPEPEQITEITTTKELIERGESLLCYSQHEEENAKIDSTHYFDNENERMRTDSKIEMLDEDQVLRTSYLIKDNWAYTWGNLEVAGIEGLKFNLDNEELKEEQDELDLEEELEFTCQAWQVDEIVFDLPADINFINMSEMVEQMINIEIPEFDDNDIQSRIEEEIGDFDLDAWMQ